MSVLYMPLTLNDYNNHKDNMNLFDKVVYEDLYQFLNAKSSPYEGYHADMVVSPKCPYHNEYFSMQKLNAIELFNGWFPKLEVILDNGDKKKLARIGDDMIHSKDMVDLTWAATQLRKVVSAYLQQQ